MVLRRLGHPGNHLRWAKRRFVGWQAPNQDIGTRILEALFASVVFLLVYGAAFFLISGAALADAGAQLGQALTRWHGAVTWYLRRSFSSESPPCSRPTP